MNKSIKILFIVIAVIVAAFLLIQLIPYGRDHTNPPVIQEPAWDSHATREIVSRACFDCHSNETIWPWYSNVAPISWLVQHDVDEGRRHVNFSEWQANNGYIAEELREVIQVGEMPPFQYLIIHSEARLSDAEKDQLLMGFSATFGGNSN